MPQVLFAVLCDDVREEVGGKFSLMGLFTQFNVMDFTQHLPPFHIFAQISFEQEKQCVLAIELRTAEGAKIFEIRGPLQAPVASESAKPIATINFRIGNLQLPRPGRYEFAIICDGQTLHTLPFDAIVPKQPFIH